MSISFKRKLHLEKLAEFNRGKPSKLKGRKLPPRSVKWSKNISRGKKGCIAWNKGSILKDNPKYKNIFGRKKGFKLTKAEKELRRKASLKMWDRRGRTFNSKTRMYDAKLKDWRKDVFERDNWTCQLCGKRGGNIEAHHKKGWAKYPKLRYKLNNGITLCIPCHKKVDKFRH